MISKEKLKKILEKAVWAPSGDNSQPWRFRIVNENTIRIFNIPGKDNPILNYQQSGSYVAHGALIFNIRLIAAVEGLKASVIYFPGDKDCTAEVVFYEGHEPTKKELELAKVVARRRSNRKHYFKKPLLDSHKKTILEVGSNLLNTDEPIFAFSADDINKTKFARSLATMEDIALRVPELHKLFFKDILWEKQDNDSGKPGLYIKSMELPFPAQIAMRALKKWKITHFLNSSIGLSKKIASQMSTVYRDSASYGGIFLSHYDPKKYITVGEKMQQVWLTATAVGVSVQPVTGLFFLRYRLESGDISPIPKNFEIEIDEAYRLVRSAFSVDGAGHLVFLLRFGYSNPPSVNPYRLPPDIVYS